MTAEDKYVLILFSLDSIVSLTPQNDFTLAVVSEKKNLPTVLHNLWCTI